MPLIPPDSEAPTAVVSEVTPVTEDELQPLSNRDRDMFLDLIENPPEPNDAFRKAAEAYQHRHGRDAEGSAE